VNKPIALAYGVPGGGSQDVALITRFSNAPAARRFEGKNGDPYDPAKSTLGPNAKEPNVVTVGVDPANKQQKLFAEHGKASPAMVLGVVDRSDLGLRPVLGSLKVRVQLAKITKLGFPLTSDQSDQVTGIKFGSVDQN